MSNSRRKFLRSAGLSTAGLFFLPGIANFGFSPADNTDENNTPDKIKPARLKVGDTVAITAPAGALWDEGKTVNSFTQVLQKLGFKVVLGKSLEKRHGYFAGTDEERANELNAFFANQEVRAVFCAKGGWGSSRLLELLNFNRIRENPKILMGFSDITTLLNAIYSKTGLVTFHGPVGNSSWNSFTIEHFISVVMQAQKTNFVFPEGKQKEATTLNGGSCTGELVGGNLTVLAAMVGTGFLPMFKNKILFLEEAHEEPYSIDRMLTQLKLSGVFDEVKGIVFGKCTECEAEEPEKSFTVQEVLQQHFANAGIPVLSGAAFGHVENKWTLPIGVNAELNATAGTLSLLESAVQ